MRFEIYPTHESATEAFREFVSENLFKSNMNEGSLTVTTPTEKIKYLDGGNLKYSLLGFVLYGTQPSSINFNFVPTNEDWTLAVTQMLHLGTKPTLYGNKWDPEKILKGKRK